LVLAILLPPALSAQSGAFSAAFDIRSGGVSFEVPTSVPGVEVKGKSNAMTGHVAGTRDERGLTLEHLDVSVPVRSLATGMKLRDEHMQKYIFTVGNSEMPDVHFSAESIFCPASLTAQEFACQVAGSLSIRGLARPFAIRLHVREQSGSPLAFHCAGDGVVKLSDYEIVPPSQFGVTASNEVKLRLDFSAKQGAAATTATGGVR
jgi:polyisoprenoid-binding protein YceI